MKASSLVQNYVDQELVVVGKKQAATVRWHNPVVPWLRINVDDVVPCESNFRELGVHSRQKV